MNIIFFKIIWGKCKDFKFYFNKVLMCMNLLLKWYVFLIVVVFFNYIEGICRFY